MKEIIKEEEEQKKVHTTFDTEPFITESTTDENVPKIRNNHSVPNVLKEKYNSSQYIYEDPFDLCQELDSINISPLKKYFPEMHSTSRRIKKERRKGKLGRPFKSGKKPRKSGDSALSLESMHENYDSPLSSKRNKYCESDQDEDSSEEGSEYSYTEEEEEIQLNQRESQIRPSSEFKQFNQVFAQYREDAIPRTTTIIREDVSIFSIQGMIHELQENSYNQYEMLKANLHFQDIAFEQRLLMRNLRRGKRNHYLL